MAIKLKNSSKKYEEYKETEREKTQINAVEETAGKTNRSGGRKQALGIILALFISALASAGILAFYPWLSREMQTGKTVMSLDEWEKSNEEAYEKLFSEEEGNTDIVYPDYESDSYYGWETADSAAYQGHEIFAGDEVWILPGYERTESFLEMLTCVLTILVMASALILAGVKGLGMTELFICKLPFELMAFAGILFFGIALGSGIGPEMACSALSGETAAVLGGDYYHISPEMSEAIIAGINFTGWFSLALVLFWMTVTSASIFTLGPVRWFKERTLTGACFRAGQRFMAKGWEQLQKTDLSEKSTRTLLKIVGLNFILLTVLCSMWFFGIFGLVVYSVILYVLLRRLYDRVQEKYKILLKATNELAEGNLDVEITEDLGIFTPFGDEIKKIRRGFKKAVEEEVKSQRMKTELITNVSHDLKTPLTAIITYVNLLKEPGISEKEREEYIRVLDQKSMRLKGLIEDLFEVSKANSRNISLNLAKLDVVSLMKQVRLELDDKIRESGIDFRFRLPDHKVNLLLDSEKTYRVFENLMVNIVKYGMPGTRAYIEIEDGMDAGEETKDPEDGDKKGTEGREKQGEVRITMKNISAAELAADGRDLTERFVRGDQSRNTEGSGLGLAIAKSFVELQKGRFELQTEADLFKVTIVWKKEEDC